MQIMRSLFLVTLTVAICATPAKATPVGSKHAQKLVKAMSDLKLAYRTNADGSLEWDVGFLCGQRYGECVRMNWNKCRFEPAGPRSPIELAGYTKTTGMDGLEDLIYLASWYGVDHYFDNGTT